MDTTGSALVGVMARPMDPAKLTSSGRRLPANPSATYSSNCAAVRLSSRLVSGLVGLALVLVLAAFRLALAASLALAAAALA